MSDPYLDGIGKRWPGVVAELAALTEPVSITRENVDQLLDTHQLQVHMKSGAWWECRRNGATRRWKRDATRIYVPFKYGFKFYGNITEADFRPDGSLDLLYYRVRPPADVRK